METIQQGMKRTELAFEAGLPGENKRRKIIVVTIGVLVLCCWALLALYSIVGGKQNDLSFAPEVVYMPQAPAPEAGSGPSFYQAPRRGTLMYKPAASYRHSVSYTPAPKAQMGSTSYRVHQTSKATVHSYGGGGISGGGNTGAIIRRSSSYNNNYAYAGGNLGGGVNYAALAYSGAIYVPTTRNAVTEVGSLEASDFSAQKMSVVRRPKTDNGLPDPNPDPFPSEEPPVPLGDLPLAMLALLAAGYALRVALRRKEESTGIAG